MSQSQEVSYRNAVLIVWDMQNGIARRAFNFKQIVGNARLLVDAAHRRQIPVIYSQHTGLPSQYLTRYAAYSLKRRGVDPSKSSFMAEGSDEWKVVSELTPSKDDLVLKKHGAPAHLRKRSLGF